MRIKRRQALIVMLGTILTGLGSMPALGERSVMTTKVLSLEDMVGADVYRKAGLQKLTESEQAVLANWVNEYMNFIAKSIEDDCRRGRAQ